MRIPLSELGLDCEKKECTYSHVNRFSECECCHSCIESENYNLRVAENEKSFLVINLKKLRESPLTDEWLSKYAKSFMRIEKCTD